MVKTKHSPLTQILKDCHSLERALKKNSLRKLQLAIEFEYYHYRKNLDRTDIHIRFEKAFKLLLKYKALTEKSGGVYAINRTHYEHFLNLMLK